MDELPMTFSEMNLT